MTDTLDKHTTALAAYLAALVATARTKPGNHPALREVLDGMELRLRELRRDLGLG